jgi:signal transduction histidine kinase
LCGSCCKGGDGTLYFGGANGFSSFHPEKLEKNEHVPVVVITRFQKLGIDMDIGALSGENPTIRLGYDENIFSLEFAALDYAEPAKNLYGYRLEGYENTWIKSGNRRFAGYSRVPPGEYVFHVVGSNNDGTWNEEGAKVRIIISPPFWMTWQFQAFVGFLTIGLAVTLYKLRTTAIKRQRNVLQKEVEERRLAEGRLLANQARLRSLASELTLAEERERQRISQLLHDKIGQALTMSKAILDKHRADKPDSAADPNLDMVIGILNEAVRDTRSLTVELSPPSLQKHGLEAAAESLLDHFGKENGIKTMIIRGVKSPLSADVSVLLYQALRELLINVYKHAEATSVVVKINNDGEKAILSVEDNGKGFDADAVLKAEDDFKGYGLYSIHERLESVGGRLSIASRTGKGTTVRVTAPLLGKE